MLKIIVHILLVTMITGCSEQGGDKQPFNPPQDVVKRDMIVNGYVGTAVLPYQQIYEFKIESRGDLDVFQMTTCHTEETKERAWNVQQTLRYGLFGWGRKTIDKKREVEFMFKPSTIEADGLCHMELQAFENGGNSSFALVDFENPRFKLQAYMQCNGIAYKSNAGTTLCQARYDTIQAISFDEVVDVDKNNKCGIVAGKKVIEYKMPLGRCLVIFKSRLTKNMHKLTIFGYNKTLVRQ